MKTLVGREYETFLGGYRHYAEGETGNPATQDFDMVVSSAHCFDGVAKEVMTPAGQFRIEFAEGVYVWADGLVALHRACHAGGEKFHAYCVTEYYRWIEPTTTTKSSEPELCKEDVKLLVRDAWGGLPIGWYLFYDFTLEVWCVGRKDGLDVGHTRLLELGTRTVQIKNTLLRNLWVLAGTVRPKVFKEDILDLIRVYLGEGWEGYELHYEPQMRKDGGGSWFYSNKVAGIELGDTLAEMTHELNFYADHAIIPQTVRTNMQITGSEVGGYTKYYWLNNRYAWDQFYIGDYTIRKMTLRWRRADLKTKIIVVEG